MTRTLMMSCYVCRRKRNDHAGDDEYEYVYNVWFIAQSVPVQETGTPAVSVDSTLSEDAAVGLGERLREAVAEVMADRVEGTVWHSGDLSEKQAADFVSSLPDAMKSLAGQPLGTLTGLAGLPGPAASFSTDVVASALLKPVVEPVERVLHAFEVAAIVIGLLTGMHPLVITCIEHLAHDELGAALSGAFEHFLSQAGVRASEQPPAMSTADVSTDAGTVNNLEATEERRHLRQLNYLVEDGTITMSGQPMNDEPSSAQPHRHVAEESGPEPVDTTLAADTVGGTSGLSALD